MNETSGSATRPADGTTGSPQGAEVPAARRGEGASRRIAALGDRFVLWLSNHWLGALNTIALIYVGLPVVAPLLMYVGLDGPGRVLHTLYRPLCHQLPQRSFFLFGPQLTYRLERLAEIAGSTVLDEPWSGAFLGSSAVGYKTALCQRDLAIYGSIFLAGLVFGVLRRHRTVRPLRWWVYVGIGVLPMLLDGGSQWISYAVATLVPSLGITPHETTPVMRVITGALFGACTVWLAYPYVEDTMTELREGLEAKSVQGEQGECSDPTGGARPV